jgi:hypothetical protein
VVLSINKKSRKCRFILLMNKRSNCATIKLEKQTYLNN